MKSNPDAAALEPGVYDTVISDELSQLMTASGLSIEQLKVDAAEAADRYDVVARAVRRAVAALPADKRVATGANLVNELIRHLDTSVNKAKLSTQQTAEPAEILTQAVPYAQTGEPLTRQRPTSPLGGTSLLTNAPAEPSLVSELRSEIDSADEIDILGAFIRFSGIRQLLTGLEGVTKRGGRVRVMTTTYTGTTEQRALDELQRIGTGVRVSYDRSATRLHAKA